MRRVDVSFYEEITHFFETSSEGYVPDEPVNHRGDHVHHQDGIADAFGVAATQTDQGGQDTQANGIDDLPFWQVIGLS